MPKEPRPSVPDPGKGTSRSVREAARDLYTRRAGYRTVPAGWFKARCLQLMDEVNETGVEIVVTKRNRPVAKLVPVSDEDVRPFVGRSTGVIHATPEALMAPVDEDWEVDADL